MTNFLFLFSTFSLFFSFVIDIELFFTFLFFSCYHFGFGISGIIQDYIYNLKLNIFYLVLLRVSFLGFLAGVFEILV